MVNEGSLNNFKFNSLASSKRLIRSWLLMLIPERPPATLEFMPLGYVLAKCSQ
jgi:hypothetical protein